MIEVNYKELFRKVITLISSPAKAWEEISLEEDRRAVMSTFVYPMIAFCGLSMFIGTLIGVGWGGSSLQLAMTNCCAVFVALFGGYFLVSYLTNQCGMRYLKRPSEPALCQQFVGYSMVVTFVLDIVTGLFPSFLILQLIFQFYVVYVVWEGAGRLMKVEENKRLVYTLSVSVFIIVAPMLIRWVFMRLSYLLQ